MNPLAGVIGEGWRIYRAHAVHLMAIAFVIFLVSALIAGLLALIGGVIGLLLSHLAELIGTFVLEASLINAVQDVRDGRADLSFGETVSAATPYLVPVAVASIMAGIAIWIGLFLLIVPGLILITIWAVIMPVIVLEQSGAVAAFRRSEELVRGNGWPVFGTLVVLFVIEIAASLVLGLIFSGLPTFLGKGLSTVIVGSIVAPFTAVVVALIYYRLSAAFAVGPATGYGNPDGTFGPA